MLKRVSTLLIFALALSVIALSTLGCTEGKLASSGGKADSHAVGEKPSVLPGLAKGIGNPAPIPNQSGKNNNPGQDDVDTMGKKPSTPPGLVKKNTDTTSATNEDKKGHGRKKFALRGKVFQVGDDYFELDVKAGTRKRVGIEEGPKDTDSIVKIVVDGDEKTIFKPKESDFEYLREVFTDEDNVWVNVKGTINNGTYTATLVIITGKPSSED